MAAPCYRECGKRSHAVMVQTGGLQLPLLVEDRPIPCYAAGHACHVSSGVAFTAALGAHCHALLAA